MPDTQPLESRIARHQLAIAFVLAGLITNAADVWVTLQVTALETNPIVLALGWESWVAVKAAALVGVVVAWWIGRKHRSSTAAAAGPAVVGLVGLAGNAPMLGWHLTKAGQWAIAALAASVLIVTLGAIGVDRLLRGVDAAIVRGRPIARRVAPAAVALLMVTSTMGGLALVGTQPLADGQSGTASAAAGDEIWTASVGSATYASPTIVNGTAYIGSQDSSLYAVDTETGNEKWSASTGSWIRSSATVADGTVYVGSADNSLYAFDAQTGEEKWSVATGDTIYDSSPTVEDGTVYVGSQDNSLYAFDAETGEQKWSAATGHYIESSPIVVGGTVYVGSLDNSLYAFDTETGSEQWSASTGDDITSSPTVANGIVYVGSFDNSLYAFDAETGDQTWSASTGGQVESSPTVADGTVYVGSNDNSLYAFDAKTGNEQWSASTGDSLSSSPTVAGGEVYVGSFDNSLYAFDAKTGSEKWTQSTGGLVGSSPTVADGTVYVGSGDGSLYAFDTGHSKDSSGSRTQLHTLGHVGPVGASSGGGSPDLNGTVENQNGQPVENATVTVSGIDRAAIDADPGKIDDRINEIEEQLNNPRPPNFSADMQLTGSDGLFVEAETQYVATHEKGDWGLTSYSQSASLGNPAIQLPAGEGIALSVWDPVAGSLVQNSINSQLPGVVVDDTDIVVESIDATGDPVNRRTIETDEAYSNELFGVGTASADLATTTLPAGFYRVHPEGSPETAYPIVVGDPDEIVASIEEDLRNQENQLSTRAQEIRDYMDRDVLKQYTTITNENGSWSANVPDSVTRVSVQAHKAPPGLDQDPQNASLQDVREFYAVTQYNGSFVTPADTGTYSVPRNGITVDVVETEAPQFADLGRYSNATEAFQNLLQNMSYSDLPSSLQQRLGGLDRDRLEETADELQRLTNQNSRLESRVEELMNRDLGEIQINDSSDAELRERVQAQQQAINELRSTIETSDSAAEVTEGVADASATFAESLSSDQVRVIAQFPNGTSREVPEEFISLDRSAGTIVGQGGTEVAVEDFPIDDASRVQFTYEVATESGVGKTTASALDPRADSIGLDAISLSSLRPGPDEQVDVTLIGDDETQVANIRNIRAVAPDGTEIDATSAGPKTATFTTSGEGRHYVEVSFETASGGQGTLTYRINAAANDQAMPPGIRIKDTPFGTLAVIGDGYEAGSVDIANGGTQIDVLAQVGADEDAPARTHLYAHATDLPPASTLSVSIVRGEQQRAVQRHVEVTAHLPAISSESPILYRGDDALPRSGEGQIASVTTSADETTIVTVTDADGALSLETNSNPGWDERIGWWLNRNTPEFSVPFVGQIPSFPVAPLPVESEMPGKTGPLQARVSAPATAAPA